MAERAGFEPALGYEPKHAFQAWTAQSRIPAWVGLWPVHVAMILIIGVLFYRQLYGFRLLRASR